VDSLVEVTPVSKLMDHFAPQRAAFDWIVKSDPAKVDPCVFEAVAQRYAMATLYYSTSIYGWMTEDNSTWLSGESECDWVGVSCGENTTSITGLSLSYHSLPEAFPDEIKVLTSLKTFDVAVDLIEGSLPDVYEQLPNLEAFHIKSNESPSLVTGEPSMAPTVETSSATSHALFPASVVNIVVAGLSVIACALIG